MYQEIYPELLQTPTMRIVYLVKDGIARADILDQWTAKVYQDVNMDAMAWNEPVVQLHVSAYDIRYPVLFQTMQKRAFAIAWTWHGQRTGKPFVAPKAEATR